MRNTVATLLYIIIYSLQPHTYYRCITNFETKYFLSIYSNDFMILHSFHECHTSLVFAESIS